MNVEDKLRRKSLSRYSVAKENIVQKMHAWPTQRSRVDLECQILIGSLKEQQKKREIRVENMRL